MVFTFRRNNPGAAPIRAFIPAWLKRFGYFTRLLAATGLMMGASALSANAASVTLAWDNSPETDVTAYRVYVGTVSRGYSTTTTVSNVTSLRLTNLVAGVKYYFAVTARNLAGLESDYSQEISFTPSTAPVVPPNGATLTLRVNSQRQPVLGGTGKPGISYDVLYASKPGGPWTALDTTTASTNGVISFTDLTKANTQAGRFYRLRQK